MVTEEKRRPGRPPSTEPSTETMQINVKVTPDLRRRIRVAAARKLISISQWIKDAAEEKLEREEAEE